MGASMVVYPLYIDKQGSPKLMDGVMAARSTLAHLPRLPVPQASLVSLPCAWRDAGCYVHGHECRVI